MQIRSDLHGPQALEGRHGPTSQLRTAWAHLPVATVANVPKENSDKETVGTCWRLALMMRVAKRYVTIKVARIAA